MNVWFHEPHAPIAAPDKIVREYVISARDRCDYTMDRIRAVTGERFKYLRNFMTDRPYFHTLRFSPVDKERTCMNTSKKNHQGPLYHDRFVDTER